MKVWQTVLLGLVQGITEFLPVSSSGHLFVVARLMGLQCDHVFLAVVLHAGTLAAVLAVFFRQVCSLFRPPFKQLGILTAATIPAAIAGFLLADKLDSLVTGISLGIAFLATAIMLAAAEYFGKRVTDKKPLGLKAGLAMGGIQCLALMPGVSRSGATIAGGLFCKCDSQDVAVFSFLMSIPIIAGACLMQVLQPTAIAASDIMPLVAGFLAAFASGLAAAKFFLAMVKRLNFRWFVVYLSAMATVCFFVL